MPQAPDFPIHTKRVVLAHVSLCRGCCCGAVEKGKPAVPVEWMKNEWKQRGIKKSMQLTISGCLGPCDLSNVVSVSSYAGTMWFGALREPSNYTALVDWASASVNLGHLLPVPPELNEFRFNPFRSPGEGIFANELTGEPS